MPPEPHAIGLGLRNALVEALTVNGRPVAVKEDGTYSTALALPLIGIKVSSGRKR